MPRSLPSVLTVEVGSASCPKLQKRDWTQKALRRARPDAKPSELKDAFELGDVDVCGRFAAKRVEGPLGEEYKRVLALCWGM